MKIKFLTKRKSILILDASYITVAEITKLTTEGTIILEYIHY